MDARAVKLTLRMFKFGLPHWRCWLIAVAGMVVYSGAMGVQVSLVKPLLGHVLIADGAKKPEPEATPARSADTAKAGVKSWFKSLPEVQWWLRVWNRWTDSLMHIGLIAAMLAPVMFVSNFCLSYFRAKVLWGAVVDIRNTLCDRLLPYSLSFFESKRSGELISNLTNDILVTQRSLTFLFGDLFLQPIQLVIGLAMALCFSWELTLLTLIGAPAIILPMQIFGRKVRKQSRRSLERLADLTDAMTQLFTGIRVVKAFKMESEESEYFHQVNQRFLEKVTRMIRARAAASATTDLVNGLALAAILIAGGVLLKKGIVTFSNFSACLAALAFMVPRPIKRLTKAYNSLQESLAAMERIVHLMDVDARLPDAPDAIEMDGLNHGIAFKNVTFAYDGGEPVLRHVSFDAPRGSVVAIVGESGSGKTTVLNLIPRFYDPIEGAVEIDGVDVRKIRHASLMDHVGIVTQSPFLFNRSIAENIRYGRRDATVEDIESAARAAHCHDFIVNDLPNGYDTNVGEMGEKLSGGQRQRITIARAILKNPSILILDEATSALDSESERLVQDALNKLMVGRTTFVVAHRLSTISHADKIIVLRKGTIAEEGTHRELLDKGGEYRRLHDMQFRGAGQAL